MSSTVTLPKSQVDKYETTIQTLQRENNQLRTSKLQLIMSTAQEIDRLRQYIHSIQQKHSTLPQPKDIEFLEEKSTVAVCEHCGSAYPQQTKVENNYFITVSSAGNNPGPGVGTDTHSNSTTEEDPNTVNITNVIHQNQSESENNYVNDEKDSHINYHNSYAAADTQSDYNEEDDGKQGSLDNCMSSDDDDIHIDQTVIDNTLANSYITPGRVSIIYNSDTFVHTRGMSNTNVPSFETTQSMGEHADIPLPDNFMDDSFVICDFCTSNLPLQFVRKYPDTMQCSKCCAFFEFIFLCNECGKCVCSECYEYEAKMQSIDRITNNFSLNINDGSVDSQKLMAFQQRLSDESASVLNRVIADRSHCLGINEFSLKLCYLICYFCDDLDLCRMTDDCGYSAQLFDIYWSLSPQKISIQKKFGFSHIHLFQSLKWANTLSKMEKKLDWNIKQVIDGDIMISNYLTNNYNQIAYDLFRNKLAKYMNETNTEYSRLLEVLYVCLDKNNIKVCEALDYNQYAWRELGGPPIVCSKGIYFIWNIPILQRSYCFNVDNRILDEEM